MATRTIRSICQYIWLEQADTELCSRILCVHICLLETIDLLSTNRFYLMFIAGSLLEVGATCFFALVLLCRQSYYKHQYCLENNRSLAMSQDELVD
jgi:hypothetical protein